MQARPTWWVLLCVFLLVGIGGLLYAFVKSIPVGVAAPVAVALAFEAALYVGAVLRPGFRIPHLPLWMTASGVVSYCVYAVPSAVFSPVSVAVLAAAAAVLSFWFVVFPRRPVVDLVFVALIAAGMLSPLFARVYVAPWPKLPLAILGQLMWTRLALVSALSLGQMEVKGFGFFPTAREWRAGVTNFALFLVPGFVLGWATGFGSLHIRPWPWWEIAALAAATFLGMFCFVALREEFFVRGLLLEWLERWLASGWVALVVTSILFGLCHLGFRRFPNWRMVLLATVAGIFYGRAYQTAKSVRAAMVTHALVNTVWRVFF